MTTDPAGRRSVILTCGCALWFAPPVPVRGERAWCQKHASWQKVKHAPGMYRSRCLNCSAGRQYGSMLGKAVLEMGKHLRRYPSHKMHLYDGLLVIEEVEAEKQPIPALVLGVDNPPPF